MEKGILKQLPAHIIEEILYTLPVKSLLRFTCVSKSWRSLISNKGFIREHLHRSNSGTNLNLIFTYQYHQRRQIRVRRNKIGSCCIGSLLDDDEPNPCLPSNLSIPIPIPIPILEDNDDIFFLGSCNSLIFITINYRELYLWNPSTRKAKNILFPQETNWQRSMLAYGFGYDESTSDYKFVCNFLGLESYEKQMYLYNSRTDSWKTIQNFDQGSLPHAPAKFVNGKLHWLSKKDAYHATTSWYIVSLDLVEEEKYQIVAPPHCYSSDYDYPLSPVLGDLGGYLSLIGYKRKMNTMDVWIMKKESWSKIWTFSDRFGRFPMPLWLKKNGDIVVTFKSHLITYRAKDKLHQSRVDVLKSIVKSVVYVESLVSPFGD